MGLLYLYLLQANGWHQSDNVLSFLFNIPHFLATLPWLRWLVSGVLPRRPEFDSRPVRVSLSVKLAHHRVRSR